MRENPWEILPPGSQGSLSALRIIDSKVLDAFWGRKPNGRLALLVTLRNEKELPSDPPSLRGVDILVLAPQRQVQFILQSGGDWEMFHALCIDLLTAANSGRDESAALQIMLARLMRWHRLLSKARSHLLDERAVRGLLGELLFLRDRLLPAIGAAAIECWQGPEGLPQDFVFSGRLVEVKTHAAGTDPSIRITSAEQLTSRDVPLFLHVICLVRQQEALTLPRIVGEIRSILGSLADAEEAFEDRLATMGYMDLPEYQGMSYAITSVSDYQVRDGFPRLTVDDMPSGLTDVSYSIQLVQLRPFEIETSTLLGN
jgi:hypothetical protein